VVVAVEDRHPTLGRLLRQRWAAPLPDVAERIRRVPRLGREYSSDLVASADVLLATLYFGGANPSYDAFACGVPVVTLPTPLPRGRYTAALYQAMGLTDGIADSVQDYVKRAVAFGTDRAARAR